MNSPETTPDASARQVLVAARARLGALDVEVAEARAAVEARDAANAEAHAAEAAFRDFLVEDELADRPDLARRAELKARVREARGRASAGGEVEAALERLQADALEAAAECGARARGVIAEEASRLSRACHRHERLALAYRRAVEALARAARGEAERRRDDRAANALGPDGRRRDPARASYQALSVAIGGMLTYAPTVEESVRAREAIVRSAADYAARWAAFAERLDADPQITIGDPTIDDPSPVPCLTARLPEV